jgi:hypothetical protein
LPCAGIKGDEIQCDCHVTESMGIARVRILGGWTSIQDKTKSTKFVF